MVTKIAILGGGISALAAAYELKSSDPNNAFDITIYQMGWRLGGKCASSRNMADGMDLRNEEHGLHVLGGWYHNTFELMRRLYADWESLPQTDARPFDQAFLPLNGAVLFDRRPTILGIPTGWRKLAVRFPPPKGEPGIDIPDMDIETLVSRLLDWVRHFLRQSRGGLETVNDKLSIAGTGADIDSIHADYHAGTAAGWSPEQMAAFSSKIDAVAGSLTADLEQAAERLQAKQYDAKELLLEGLSKGDLSIVDLSSIALLGLYVSKGVVADRLIQRGFDAANSEEVSAWMHRHGAPDLVVNSPFVQLGYHYAFSYIDGDPTRPDMAAGTAIRGYLRMFLTYTGSFFYHFDGGIGEVLIKPFYDVLSAKGVKFQFFSQVTKLELDEAAQQICSVSLRRQAAVTAGPGAYDPLVKCTPDVRAWPDTPISEQIELAPGQAKFPDDFEDPDDLDAKDPVMAIKAGDDFDIAILAIPGTALPDICRDLTDRHPRWQRYLSSVSSCPTMSAQLWTEATPIQLGWKSLPPISTGHILPLSTWCDMSHQMKSETPSGYRGLHFLCGPYKPIRSDHRAVVRTWLNDHFDDVLPDWQNQPEKKLDRSLYVQVNTKPSDLYIFSPAGTVEKRLRCDESGIDNLFLCGDWVRNGTDLGWVEGAVTTARQCARAISGTSRRIYGESDFG